MEPIKNPIELSSQNPETTNAEVPRSPEREAANPVQEVQNKVEEVDNTLLAETEALKHPDIKHPAIEKVIAIPTIEGIDPKGDSLRSSEEENKILKKLNGVN
jgi:hypothetical protein